MIDNFQLKKVSVGTRLASMLLDHVFMTIIAMVFFIPTMATQFKAALNMNDESADSGIMDNNFVYLLMIGFALYFCKDCFGGRSIAKRILKLQVVDNATGVEASPVKCFVRNIFIIVWPVEVIVSLINPNRRIGDIIAGTKVVFFDPTMERPKVSPGQIILPFILSYGLMLVVMIPLKGFINGMQGAKVHYVESSFDQPASTELEQLLSSSMGDYFTPKVKVYDKIENQNLKYITISLQLKADYLENDADFDQLNWQTKRLIYSSFPMETFLGRIKYFYHSPGQMKMRSESLGLGQKSRKQ